MNDHFDHRKLLEDLLEDEGGRRDSEMLTRMLCYSRKRQRVKRVRNRVTLVALLIAGILVCRQTLPVRETAPVKAVQVQRPPPGRELVVVNSSMATVNLLQSDPNVPVINSLPLDPLVKRLSDSELLAILSAQHAGLFEQPGMAPQVVFGEQEAQSALR